MGMPPCIPRIAVAGLLVLLAPWMLCGCAGGKITGAAGGAGVATVSQGDFPFPGGIGQSLWTGAKQGFALDPNGYIYVSSNNLLASYDSQWHQLWRNTNVLAGLPTAVNHLGDIDYGGGYIYGPVEGWNGCTGFKPVLLAVFDPQTGNMVTWSDITADGHEASSVAVIPALNRVVVSDFCQNDGTTTLWNYDLNELTTDPPGSAMTYTSKTVLSTRIPLIQGISWNADASQFLISADIDGTAGSLWFANGSGEVTGPVYTVPTSAGIELEGVDYNSDYLTFFENGYVWGIGKPVLQPTFSLAGGTFCNAQTVSIADATAGAAVYYTTDGSMPKTSSTAYSGPITVSTTETISAIGALNGLASSAKTTATYVIDPTSCAASDPSQ